MRKRIICREDGKPYMIRYTLFSCRWFSVKLHNILISDYACLHDHPWAFFTIILKGGYVEHSAYAGKNKSRLYGPGTMLYRKALFAHRLEIHQPAWTFVVTFKRTRMWGFYTPKGWVKFFNYKGGNTCE